MPSPGLRVGLATAKALARGLGLPIAGVPTSEALLRRQAWPAAFEGGEAVLLLPAGPSDRVVVAGGQAVWSAAARSPSWSRARRSWPSICRAGRPAAALALGAQAEAGLAAALLRLGCAGWRPAATTSRCLVPEYVTLPRGVAGAERGGAMVARPPVRIVVDRMKVEDLPAVHVIERESFSTPWPAHAYRQELETNRLAHYIVARWGDEIVGFAGCGCSSTRPT